MTLHSSKDAMSFKRKNPFKSTKSSCLLTVNKLLAFDSQMVTRTQSSSKSKDTKNRIKDWLNFVAENPVFHRAI